VKKIGWFTTGRGPGSYNLFRTMLEEIASGRIDAQIAFVFINRDINDNDHRRKLVQMAEEHRIPVIIFPSDTFCPELKRQDLEAWRAAYGAGLRERIASHPMDFGVLAGYMLIIDPQTCRRHTLINLHPALPDTYKGTWEEIVGLVVANQDESYGAMVHICSPELDRGEIIAFDTFEVRPLRTPSTTTEELVQRIRAEEVKREAPLLMETIKLLVNGEIVLRDGTVLDRKGQHLTEHPCLAQIIDRNLAKR
jgi:phosphoribosylglycinamide formyltransferase 1